MKRKGGPNETVEKIQTAGVKKPIIDQLDLKVGIETISAEGGGKKKKKEKARDFLHRHLTPIVKGSK